MQKYFEILKKCSLFADINEQNLFTMLKCLGARVVEFDKKYTILSEGSTARYIGILLSGSAQIEQVDYYGNRTILSRLEPSEVFGEAFACADILEIPVTVVANEPCEVMLIDSNHIVHTCNNNCGFHQQLIFNLMRDLAKKVIMFHSKIEITSKRTTRDKLMAYLLLQAKNNKSNSFSIPFDRQQLADYLEVERSGLSAEIGKLKREGVIDSYKKNFKLLDF